MQIADVVLNNITAPDWVFQVLMLFLAVGLPIAVIFAWAFEMTPEGLKREHEVDRSQSITGVTGRKLNNVITILLVLALAYFVWESRIADEPAAQASRLSIAVLPFVNRSNRQEDEFFTTGIHDDLLTTIAKIGSLKVISRTSVMEYKDTTKKIPQIARELGVANILEGGIQRTGNQVRINVQLIDAVTDEHLWAEIYDRELTAENIFAIQSEISKAIAEALHHFDELFPKVVQHVDRYNPDVCYLAAGDTEKALASIEQQFEHGHFGDWAFDHTLPLYDLIWEHPRYVAVRENIEIKLAEQRAIAGL